jgi:2,4-dienoyl-CoA reductase-like NADH-dependent reductase (Old Yellow Enzyme family)
MICGKIYDRATAEDALKDADIVLSAKSMLPNSDWVEDMRQGKALPLYKSSEANIAYTDNPLSEVYNSGSWLCRRIVILVCIPA